MPPPGTKTSYPRAEATDRRRREKRHPDLDLAALGHEVRAPLAAIAMLVSHLDETAGAPDPAVLGHLRLAVAQAMAVADDLLAADGGRAVPTSPRDVNPSALVREVAALYDAAFAGEGRRVEVTVAPDLPERIVTDPVRLRQVLINLIANALRAAPTGNVTLRLDAGDGSQTVGFSVGDEGSGFPQGFAIARFHRGAESSGTGLGLWISARIVRALGGKLVLGRREPRGAVASFSIRQLLNAARRLPAGRGEARAATGGVDDAPTSLDGLAILVVDDSEVARLTMATMLDSFGVTPMLAADAAAAVALVAERRPDAIVVDWSLGNRSGGDALDRIERASPKRRLPPVVVATAAMQQPLERRADAFLEKPFTPRELYGALVAALAGKGAGRAKA